MKGWGDFHNSHQPWRFSYKKIMNILMRKSAQSQHWWTIAEISALMQCMRKPPTMHQIMAALTSPSFELLQETSTTAAAYRITSYKREFQRASRHKQKRDIQRFYDNPDPNTVFDAVHYS